MVFADSILIKPGHVEGEDFEIARIRTAGFLWRDRDENYGNMLLLLYAPELLDAAEGVIAGEPGAIDRLTKVRHEITRERS